MKRDTSERMRSGKKETSERISNGKEKRDTERMLSGINGTSVRMRSGKKETSKHTREKTHAKWIKERRMNACAVKKRERRPNACAISSSSVNLVPIGWVTHVQRTSNGELFYSRVDIMLYSLISFAEY